MKLCKLTLIIFFIFSLFTACFQPKKSSKELLGSKIQQLLKSEQGTYAIAFSDLQDSTNSFFRNEKEMFHAASTMKTPVMFEIFKQQKEGKFSVQDSILVKNAFRSIVDSSLYTMDLGEDSDEIFYEQIGLNATIYDLMYEMIIRSSNLATNILIDLVSAEKVTNSMRSIGADSILVLRGVEDLKAYEAGLSNITNAYDLMLLFEEMGREKLVDREASNKMIKILADQQFDEIIPALLPDSTVVAHKTGSITKISHDSGIVFLPDGRKYVLILLSKNWEDKEQARKTMANISLLFYEHMQI